MDRADLPPGLGRADIQQPGLVQMDMRLDQPPACQPTTGVELFCIGRKSRLDRDDYSVGDADVAQLAFGMIGKLRPANDEIHATRRFP